MTIQSFTEWLFSEAGAGWVFGLVSLIALAVSIYNRRRPDRVVINELYKKRLIDVRDEIGDKVQITYGGNPVEILWQINIEIFNEGVKVIKEAVISCTLPEGAKILDLSLTSSTGELHIQTEVRENTATIKLPYINSYREHNHVIKLLINIDHEVGAILFEGAGEGWSVRHNPLLTEKQEGRLVLFAALTLFVAAGGSFVLARFWDVTFMEINLKTVFVMLPVLVIAVISVLKLIKGRYRKERFHLNRSSLESK